MDRMCLCLGYIPTPIYYITVFYTTLCFEFLPWLTLVPGGAVTCFDPTWIAGSSFDLRTDLRSGARSFWTMREKAKVLRKVCNVESSSFNLAVSPFKENNKLPIRFGMAIVSEIRSTLINFLIKLLLCAASIAYRESPCMRNSSAFL